MPENVGDQLRKLLSQQVDAVSEEAVRSGAAVDPEQLEALTRLSHLVDLNQSVRTTPLRKRLFWAGAVTAITLAIASLLLFVHVKETELEGDFALSEVSFVLPTEQVLTEAMDLSTLGVSGLKEIKLPRAAERISQTLSSSEGSQSAVRLSVAANGKRQGTITLAPLKLPAKTHVWVSSGLPRQYRVSLKGTNAELNADVNGPTEIAFSGGGSAQLDFETPDVAVMKSGENEVDLDLTFPEAGNKNLSSQLSATELSFFHVKEFRDPAGTVVRPLSTIISGTLNFEDLNGLERKIRPGEMIQFEQSRLDIRTLRLQGDHIEMKFHGRVRDMTVGWGDNRRTIMPTLFEWIQSRNSIWLLWGSVASLFTLIAGALHLWRKA